MTATSDNGNKPAYPLPLTESNKDQSVYHIGHVDSSAIGLSKREMFAMAAMQGILSNTLFIENGTNAVLKGNLKKLDQHIAGMSIEFADELLKQLEA